MGILKIATEKMRWLLSVRREERVLAVLMLVIFVTFDALVIARYYDLFTPLAEKYWATFVHNFHLSGFDPLTYCVVSDWHAFYNVFRHPLLVFFMYVPYMLNRGLMWLLGINCAVFIVAAIQTFCAFYSMIFLRRTLREVVGLGRGDASLLTLLFFSFAYVLLSAMAPDHFVISMMLILLTVYVCGRKLKSGRSIGIGQSLLLFVLTAGVSLNNGLKVFLASLFVRGRRFFRPVYLVCAVLLPAALMWGVSKTEYARMVWPMEMAHRAAKAERAAKEKTARTLQMHNDSIAALTHGRTAKTVSVKDDSAKTSATDSTKTATTKAKPSKKRPPRVHQGRPISKGEFMKWTDITTSRPKSVVENLFGESLQLHRDHLLEDELGARPMIVTYRSWWNYAVEALTVLLFFAGVWCGRRERFLWMCMSCFALDMVLHIGLGFGINEVYIMTAHWAYVMPVAMAFLLSAAKGRTRQWLRVVIALLTVYLWTYNGSLIGGYLVG